MPWTHEIRTGKLYDPTGKCIDVGYAGGNCGSNPEGINNPDLQDKHDVGPLPVGRFRFGTPLNHSKLGVFAIPLIPDPANEMYGRGGFFMHGDKSAPPRSASEGCPIHANAARHAAWDSPDHDLDVVVDFVPA